MANARSPGAGGNPLMPWFPARPAHPAHPARPAHAEGGELDFALDDVVARPGWLRRVSRGQMRTLAKFLDLAVIGGAACAAARIGGAPAGPPGLLAAAALMFASHAAFLRSGLYNADRLIEPARAMRPLTTAWTVIFIVAAGLPVLTHQDVTPRFWLITFYAIGLLALVATRWCFEPLMRAWVAHGHCTRSVAIVGANEAASQLVRRLRHNPYGIRVIGVYDDRALTPGRSRHLTRLGPVADLVSHPGQIDLVVITLPLTEAARIAAITSELRRRPSKLRLLPGRIGLDPLSPLNLQRADLPGIHLIEIRE